MPIHTCPHASTGQFGRHGASVGRLATVCRTRQGTANSLLSCLVVYLFKILAYFIQFCSPGFMLVCLCMFVSQCIGRQTLSFGLKDTTTDGVETFKPETGRWDKNATSLRTYAVSNSSSSLSIQYWGMLRLQPEVETIPLQEYVFSFDIEVRAYVRTCIISIHVYFSLYVDERTRTTCRYPKFMYMFACRFMHFIRTYIYCAPLADIPNLCICLHVVSWILYGHTFIAVKSMSSLIPAYTYMCTHVFMHIYTHVSTYHLAICQHVYTCILYTYFHTESCVCACTCTHTYLSFVEYDHPLTSSTYTPFCTHAIFHAQNPSKKQPASPVHIEVEGITIAQSMLETEDGPLSSASCCSEIGDSTCFESGGPSIQDTHPLAITAPFFCKAVISHDNPYPCDRSFLRNPPYIHTYIYAYIYK